MQTPSSRQLGYIIGGSLSDGPTAQLANAQPSNVLEAAGLTRQRLVDEYLLIAAAASLHAIEMAGLSAEAESDAAQGFYDWIAKLPEPTREVVKDSLEWAVEAYSEAAADDAAGTGASGPVSQIELEFMDRLLDLGDDIESRVSACGRLGLTTPKHLWHVYVANANTTLKAAMLAIPAGSSVARS
jgi:hypothetical protein